MNGLQWLMLGIALIVSGNLGLLADEPHRSPFALAVSADRSVCLTANHTAGSISLVDLSSHQVLDELAVENGPVDIIWLDDSAALVSLQNDDAVAVIKRMGAKLELVRTCVVGDEPYGLAVSKDGRRVFVALGADDAVAVLDISALSLNENTNDESGVKIDVPKRSLTVGGIPRALTVSPDGRWLVTCCSVPCEVFVHEADSLELVSSRKIFDGGFNPGNPAITADSQLVILPSAINRAFQVTARMIDIGWVIDNRISKLPLPNGEPGAQKQLGLDIRGKAVGDANSVAFSPDGQFLVVTCGGTHELLVLEFPSIPWPKGDPGDFLPEPLRNDSSRFRRIKLGGRPVDVQFVGQNQVVVANYLSDSLQFVDITTNNITKTVSLGGPSEMSAIRRGEIVFYDADRSMHSWFSCHTCHTDGHTSGQVFDTQNDRSYGTPKLIPSLRGVADTGPWTWHGWQTDLHDAMRRSLQESMSTEKPISQEDVDALVAYLATLKHPASSRSGQGTASVSDGRALFDGKAGCVKCHTNPTFTSTENFDGGVEDSKDRNKEYNPPSLRGVSSRRRFLHTGKAKSLEQVLTDYHRPEDVVGVSLTPEEISAIVSYLKSI